MTNTTGINLQSIKEYLSARLKKGSYLTPCGIVNYFPGQHKAFVIFQSVTLKRMLNIHNAI